MIIVIEDKEPKCICPSEEGFLSYCPVHGDYGFGFNRNSGRREETEGFDDAGAA